VAGFNPGAAARHSKSAAIHRSPFKKISNPPRERDPSQRLGGQGPCLSMATHLLDSILKPVDPWFWPGF